MTPSRLDHAIALVLILTAIALGAAGCVLILRVIH
ncbi:MAG: hypothetical protein RJA49_2047 [Actinomycetota bacterium]